MLSNTLNDQLTADDCELKLILIKGPETQEKESDKEISLTMKNFKLVVRLRENQLSEDMTQTHTFTAEQNREGEVDSQKTIQLEKQLFLPPKSEKIDLPNASKRKQQ